MHNLYTLQEASFHSSTHHKIILKIFKGKYTVLFWNIKTCSQDKSNISELDTTPIYFRRISSSDKGT